MAIKFGTTGEVDNRPVYTSPDEIDGKYNKLFEDSEGKFILFPNGYYSGERNTYLVFQNKLVTNENVLMLVGRAGTPLPIVWPLRPARSSVSITISGDA